MPPSVAQTSSSLKNLRGSKSAISWFTFRRSVFGGLLFGLFATAESYAQGRGIIAAFPNLTQRALIIHGLANNAALGLFYGDKTANIVSPSGYMVYRIMPILVLVAAIWAMTITTKMLRGQEENGRWELLLSGPFSSGQATLKSVLGIFGVFVGSFLVFGLTLALLSSKGAFRLTLGGSLYFALCILAGGIIGLAIGAITSQLAATRRSAMLYAAALIIVFFAVRSVANIINGLIWLKNLTPFGWIDKLRPFYYAQPIWFLPIVLFAGVCLVSAILLSSKRDLGQSLIADKDSAKPKFGLLNSQLGLNFRLLRNVLFGWLLGGVAFATLIASIDKTVAKTLGSSGSKGRLIKTFSNLTGNPDSRIEIAYLSAAGFFTITLLLIMTANYLSALRDEETSGRLDNLISGTLSRGYWLYARLALVLGAAVTITFIANVVIWALAAAQGISVSFLTLVLGGLNILGPLMLLLGIGVMVYGLVPKVLSIVMYALIGWSFTIDIISSALKLSKGFSDTSLLHYVSLVPAANPNWRTFTLISLIGLAGILIGAIVFDRRDLQIE